METIISLPPKGNVDEILSNWTAFCSSTESLLLLLLLPSVSLNQNNHDNNLSISTTIRSEFNSQLHSLSKYGLESLVVDHFFHSLQVTFEQKCAPKFWQHFDAYIDDSSSTLMNKESGLEEVLFNALEELSLEKQHQERSLSVLIHGLQLRNDNSSNDEISDVKREYLVSKYQLMVSSVLMSSLPRQFPAILHQYFKGRLEELTALMDGGSLNDEDYIADEYLDLDKRFKSSSTGAEMNIDEHLHLKKISVNSSSVKKNKNVVQDLRTLGFTAISGAAYASAIFLLLKHKVQDLAGNDAWSSVLGSIKEWIQAVPLRFLHTLLTDLDDPVFPESPDSGLMSCPSPFCSGVDAPTEALVRWKLRLDYFAYETLQGIRTAKLFDIIVDYPDSSPAIEDLKQCLDYTGQYSKLVDSFISVLKYRLLTAGASTNDILLQYVSTTKSLRTIDPAGTFLKAVGDHISEYLRGRKDTLKSLVTMLTDNSGGAAGVNLLEELGGSEDFQENVGLDDDMIVNDKQAWLNALRWEPDSVESVPPKGSKSRIKVDILGMIVGIMGSKDHLVNEYHVMLAAKLLDKSDYDIDAEIETLELLKIHLGESIMQKCEIMLNDLIDSKRINSNIKATIAKPSQAGEVAKAGLSLNSLDSTILSSNFWPPIQDEAIKLPQSVDQVLSDYAKRYHEIKTPRKLIWKKNLGVVKLVLELKDRAVQFSVSPLLASIIMQFQEQTCWTSKNLADAVGVPIDMLNRRIQFWISKGIVAESIVDDTADHIFTLLELRDSCSDEFLVGEEDEDISMATVEDQLRMEETVYQKFIQFLLTNFDGMALNIIHNNFKKFLDDPPYDKSLQQLETFLAVLVSQDKLELRDGMYFLKK